MVLVERVSAFTEAALLADNPLFLPDAILSM